MFRRSYRSFHEIETERSDRLKEEVKEAKETSRRALLSNYKPGSSMASSKSWNDLNGTWSAFTSVECILSLNCRAECTEESTCREAFYVRSPTNQFIEWFHEKLFFPLEKQAPFKIVFLAFCFCEEYVSFLLIFQNCQNCHVQNCLWKQNNVQNFFQRRNNNRFYNFTLDEANCC